MWLTGDGAALSPGKGSGDRVCGGAQPGCLAAVDDKGWKLDARDPRPRQRVVTHDDGVNILDFALDRVRLGHSTLAVTPAIEVEDGEILGQQRGEGRLLRAVAGDAADDDHRRPLARLLIGDPSSILRRDRV